jgi:hypothetical protein
MPGGWRRCHGAPAVEQPPSITADRSPSTTPERRREPNRHFDIAELDDYLRPFRPEVPVAIFPADLDPVAGGVHRWPAVVSCRCSHLLSCLDAGSTPDACLQLASGGCRPEPGATFSVASTVRPVAVQRPREASDAAVTSTRQSHSSALMGRDLGRRRRQSGRPTASLGVNARTSCPARPTSRVRVSCEGPQC